MKTVIFRIIVVLTIVIFFVIIFYFIFPDSTLGFNNIKDAIERDPNFKEDQTSWTRILFNDFVATMERFIYSCIIVVILSLILALFFSKFKKIRVIIDQFSESLRTIPATAWAFPIAMIPLVWINLQVALYLSTILSACPVLTLGLINAYKEIEKTSSYQLAKKNKITLKKRYLQVFLPWWTLRSVTHVKTTFSLIFILVVVLESILSGVRITEGLGSQMGKLWISESKSNFAAEVFLLLMLSAIGVIISSSLDLINLWLNRFRD